MGYSLLPVSSSTAGKGPGIVLRAENHSGTLRLHAKLRRGKGLLEVLDSEGVHAELGLSADECRKLGQAFLKVASALSSEDLVNGTTKKKDR